MVRYKVQGNIFQGNIYKVYFIQSVLENRFLDWNMIYLSPYQIVHQKVKYFLFYGYFSGKQEQNSD